jgi:RNA polymerase sigma-70 factor (family 1)
MNDERLNSEQGDFYLLQGIRNKDHIAFTELYRKYYKSLVLASDKYVREVDIAKEIVQDVFMKIWETPFELNNDCTLKSYLYRTVINYSLNHLKREVNINQHHLKIANQVSYESLEAIQEEQELKIIIYREIEQLPSKCKQVFKLSRFEGLKYKEIAVLMGISEKTVENHMIKALKTLRERIFPQGSLNGYPKMNLTIASVLLLNSLLIGNMY